MKQLKLFVVAIICILLISSIAATSYIILNKQKEQQKPFYVGVTYCGSSVQEAKELIDKVKNYTNLFTLQSGPLVATLTINTTAINEIGDYACAANLNYAIYTSTTVSNANWIKNWTLEAKARWGEQFIGIYYHDEPGGNMLDNGEPLSWQTTANNITTIIRKEKDGSISSNEYLVKEVNEKFLISSSSSNSYYLDGKITVFTSYYSEEITDQEYKLPPEENQLANGTIIGSYKSLTTAIDYYPNGTNTANEHIQEGTIEHYINEFFTTTKNNHEKDISTVYTSENITEYPHQILPYEEVLKQHPIQTNDKTTEFFTNMNKNRFETINKSQLQEESILVFTSDYGLYWWDYKSGYDIMLAEMGWNHTITQDIGLIRGAANLQNKSWGTILTWKYDQPPYLTNGEEMFEQMKTSYQTGAEYILIFNYSEDPTNPNTLQEEHHQALERFWNEVVQNPKIKHGSIKAEAVLVLPQDYGWGMRHPNDNVWGIWQADDTSQQIWNQVQSKMEQYGLKLDIIFEDPDYPVEGKYSKIYYWNQK